MSQPEQFKQPTIIKAIKLGAVAIGSLTAATLVPIPSSASDDLTSKTYCGKWDGQASSTIKFLNEKQLRYCFRNECATLPYSGNYKRRIRFTWGTSRFTYTRAGTGYNGRFRGANGNRSQIALR